MLALVLGGLLVSGLFCSIVSSGVAAAELTSTSRLGVIGLLEAPAAPPFDEFPDVANISRSSAVICRPVLSFFNPAKCGFISSTKASRSGPSRCCISFSIDWLVWEYGERIRT